MGNEFTVLFPVYRNENSSYFKIALDSIIDQSLVPTEILILVDGPIEDDLRNILDEYSKEYSSIIRIIYFKENRGLGRVLHDGVEHAKYDIIARMDSDDISLPTRFEEQIKYFIKHNLDLLGTPIIEFNSKTNELQIRDVPNRNELPKFIDKRCPFNHMSVMYKKSSVLRVGNYENIMHLEDYYLWYKMYRMGMKMDNMDKPLVKARIDNLYEKRSGWKYFKWELNLQKQLRKSGFITRRAYFRNILIRGIVRLLPKFIVKFIYKHFLREKY